MRSSRSTSVPVRGRGSFPLVALASSLKGLGLLGWSGCRQRVCSPASRKGARDKGERPDATCLGTPLSPLGIHVSPLGRGEAHLLAFLVPQVPTPSLLGHVSRPAGTYRVIGLCLLHRGKDTACGTASVGVTPRETLVPAPCELLTADVGPEDKALCPAPSPVRLPVGRRQD